MSAVAGCSTHHCAASRSLPRSSARAPSFFCSSRARSQSASRSSTTTGCPIASTSNIRSISSSGRRQSGPENRVVERVWGNRKVKNFRSSGVVSTASSTRPGRGPASRDGRPQPTAYPSRSCEGPRPPTGRRPPAGVSSSRWRASHLDHAGTLATRPAKAHLDHREPASREQTATHGVPVPVAAKDRNHRRAAGRRRGSRGSALARLAPRPPERGLDALATRPANAHPGSSSVGARGRGAHPRCRPRTASRARAGSAARQARRSTRIRSHTATPGTSASPTATSAAGSGRFSVPSRLCNGGR